MMTNKQDYLVEKQHSGKINEAGYVLLDTLLAVSLLALGFAALWGLTAAKGALAQEAYTELTAINLAQSYIEEQLYRLECGERLDEEMRQDIEPFMVYGSSSENSGLCKLEVKVVWYEKGREREYFLESWRFLPSEL